jgi:hypothetical protein
MGGLEGTPDQDNDEIRGSIPVRDSSQKREAGYQKATGGVCPKGRLILIFLKSKAFSCVNFSLDRGKIGCPLGRFRNTLLTERLLSLGNVGFLLKHTSPQGSRFVYCQRSMAHILGKGRESNFGRCNGDKYFRILARVMVDGNDLGAELIKYGLAKPYGGETKPVW